MNSNFDASIDFDALRTYRWHEGNEYNLASVRYLSNEIIDVRIRSNVDRELRPKGINLQANGPVDFLVNYSVSTQPGVDIETYNNYSGYAPGWHFEYDGTGPYRISGPGDAFDASTIETIITQFSMGTLVLDIVTPETDILVWRGVAEGKLEQSMTALEREQIIDEAVTRLLRNFPPGSR